MSKNKLVVPEAKQALNDLKMEISQELGISTYNNMASSEYPALVNGLSVREMIGMGEKILANKNKTTQYNHDLY